MDVKRPEIQECFLRAGAEYDAWDATWRVRSRAAGMDAFPGQVAAALHPCRGGKLLIW